MNGLQSLPQQGPKAVAVGKQAACSSSHPWVTQTILQVMKDGGNAIDAAIAGSLLQATIDPHMTNHGGSVSFLCYHAQSEKTYQLTSTGTMVPGMAPWSPLPKSLGKECATVPGYMPGLGAMYDAFATKPWAQLCQEAIRAAQEGYPMYSWQYGVLTEGLEVRTYFPEGRELYTPNGFLTPVGEQHRNPPLAKTLKALAQEGPDYFTTGQWAKNFVAKANALGWEIELEHMSAIPPRWHDPLRYRHGDDTVVQLAPPGQAGVFCQFTMGLLRHMGVADRGHYSQSAESLYLLAHALRWVSWELNLLRDPEIFRVPVEQWTDDDHHRNVAQIILNSLPKIDLSEHVRITGGKGGAEAAGLAGSETDSCELSIVDPQGNWVQMMHTGQYGGIPGVAVDGVWMHGSSRAGLTTGGGRLKSNTANTIVMRHDKPWLALGTPGRPSLTVPQVLHSILDFDMDPYEASDCIRLWPLAEDSTVEVESRISPQMVEDLARMGIQVQPLGTYRWNMGSFQICWRDPASNELRSSCDPRRVGEAAAF